MNTETGGGRNLSSHPATANIFYMDPVENNSGRTPLGNLTNTANAGCQSVSNSLTPVDDAKKRKRERERARYAEQRNEINMKRREKYHIKKQQSTLTDKSRGDIPNKLKTNLCALPFSSYLWCNNYVTDGVVLGEDTNNDESNDWLHRNDSYQPMQIGKENLGTIFV
ncbi:hypothetical protein BDA96_01G317100 [Sorghum bicolor]|uniref:Uncharacterized protein n=1 Tax=Sorghum bicolor TaxID=4558 RepID=A0A921V0I4_SORBI|nr:hypothetical protein BDA96_01G317100 [Sorghum bicolor]